MFGGSVNEGCRSGDTYRQRAIGGLMMIVDWTMSCRYGYPFLPGFEAYARQRNRALLSSALFRWAYISCACAPADRQCDRRQKDDGLAMQSP